jgi:hypothetical protein
MDFSLENRGIQFHKTVFLLKYANNENSKYNIETGFRASFKEKWRYSNLTQMADNS